MSILSSLVLSDVMIGMSSKFFPFSTSPRIKISPSQSNKDVSMLVSYGRDLRKLSHVHIISEELINLGV